VSVSASGDPPPPGGGTADGDRQGGGKRPITFCGLQLAHPVINASGTFDAIAARAVFGEALIAEFPFAAFVSKTITLAPHAGNRPPRLWEAPAGLINSIGLPNKGLEGYLAHDLPQLARLPAPLITNVMGSTATEIAVLLERCDAHSEIAACELNVSCPNVHTGLDIGADPATLEAVVREVRPRTSKPLIVKLTPNTADVARCALAAEAGGADAVSLINTLRAFALAPNLRLGGDEPERSDWIAPAGGSGGAASVSGSGGASPVGGSGGSASVGGSGKHAPWLGGGTGGLSGPAIRPVALAQVAAVAKAVTIPVVGMGGVQNAAHARNLLDVGATLVAVGTESFRDPAVGARIARELAL
jgi:dihydroorotate dehydrogenase (NAD+) catalytic subunit